MDNAFLCDRFELGMVYQELFHGTYHEFYIDNMPVILSIMIRCKVVLMAKNEEQEENITRKELSNNLKRSVRMFTSNPTKSNQNGKIFLAEYGGNLIYYSKN